MMMDPNAKNRVVSNAAASEVFGRPVQIAVPLPNLSDGYSVDSDEIERIFGQVLDTPVAIYSVTGAFRKGKSFMLNLFLRYLQAESNNKADSWLLPEDDMLFNGFDWRGGNVRNTRGIWIWDKPFMKNTPQGKVALFVMDTQGAFDPQSSLHDCSVVFALSTLLCSMQIYNVQSQIQEDTLRNLKIFTDYATKLKKEYEHIEYPFQELLFLIRDWNHLNFACGMEGGKKYVQSVLTDQMGHKDTQLVRNNLGKTFETISGCLVPHPGHDVTERDDEQGSYLLMKDIRKKFLSTVDSFARTIFSPERIVVKQLNNKPAKGKDLINCLLSYSKVFGIEFVPEISIIISATAKGDILSAIDKFREEYKVTMEERCAKYMKPEELTDAHQLSKQNALNEFDAHKKIGEEQLIKEHREHLDYSIEKDYLVFKEKNEIKLDEEREELRDAAINALESYTMAISEFLDENEAPGMTVENFSEQSLKESLVMYNKRTPGHQPHLVETCQSTLKKWIEQAERRINEQHEMKEETMLLDFQKLTHIAWCHYDKQMDMACNDEVLSDDDFDKTHEIAKMESLKIFDESGFVNKTKRRVEVQTVEWRKQLQLRITQGRDRYRNINSLWTKLAVMKIGEIKKTYTLSMEAAIENDYTDEERLEAAHKHAKEKAKQVIEQMDKELPVVKECWSQFDETINTAYENYKKRNEENKKNAEVQFIERMWKAYDTYKETIEKVSQRYMKEDLIYQIHEEEREKALNSLKDGETFLQESFLQSQQDELIHKIKLKYDLWLQENESLKEDLKAKAHNLSKLHVGQYLENMTKEMLGKYIKPEELTAMHETMKRFVNETMKAELEGQCPEVVNSYAKKCKQEMDDIFVLVKEQNKKNKSVYVRRGIPTMALKGVARTSFALANVAGAGLNPVKFILNGGIGVILAFANGSRESIR